jgi:EmrB/QacA subfamily drug resistance transporter
MVRLDVLAQEGREQPVPSRAVSQKVAVSVVYAASMFIAVMDTTIVNVALPTIAREFHATPASAAAVSIGFLVSLAVCIPASSWLGDRIGARQALLGSIIIFTVASALCGLAGSLSQLVAFRVLQGVGGGLMIPVGLAMLFRVFPPAERVRLSSLLIIPTTFAPVFGMVVGGLFVTELSWRWVFYVNVPIGTSAVIIGGLFLADQRSSSVKRFDVFGFLSAGLGLGLVMYGVSEGPNVGWGSDKVLGAILAGAVLLCAMVAVELRSSHPLLDLRLYGDRLFRSTTAVLTITAVAFFGVLYLLAQFFQNGLHLTPLQSGLSIFPEALGVMVGAQVISRKLYPIFGPRRIMAAGLMLFAGVVVILSRVDTGTSLWLIRVIVFFMGMSVSGAFLPTQAAGFATIPNAKTGDASTIFNAQRQVGAATGVAILTTVISSLHPVHVVAGRTVANIHAYQAGLLVAAGVAVLGAMVALTVHDEDAADTIIPRRRSFSAENRPGPVAVIET